MPAKRTRRTPSSNWSILEQRQQADITTSASDLRGESVSLSSENNSVTDTHTVTKTVNDSPQNESAVENITANVMVQPKPKRSPRTRKKAVTDSKVPAEAVTKDEAPAKRTRKRAVKIDGHQP